MAERTYDYDPDRAAWGDDMRYATPPRFSVIPNVLPRLVYDAQLHADSARIYADRLTHQLDSVLAHAMPRDQLQSVADTIADARRALDDAEAKIARLA